MRPTVDCSSVSCPGPWTAGRLRATSTSRRSPKIFPAVAYQRVAARGLLVVEGDVIRVVDNVLLPALRHR